MRKPQQPWRPTPRLPDSHPLPDLWECGDLVIPEWIARVIIAKAAEGDEYAQRFAQHLVRPDGTRVAET